MSSIYNQTIKLFGSHPEPAFESAGQQAAMWGREWGCDNDVGQIRLCLMHRPGDEMEIVDRNKRIEEIGSYGDLEAGWYFQSDTVPDWDEFRAQHDGLVRTLRREGVEVVFLDRIEADGIKSMYTRDSSVAIKGGAIVMRLARTIRRGEEAHVTRTLANLGMPILRTLHGTAMAEGGSFAWLNEKTAAIVAPSASTRRVPPDRGGAERPGRRAAAGRHDGILHPPRRRAHHDRRRCRDR